MSTFDVLSELKVQLAEAEFELQNAVQPQENDQQYQDWVEQQIMVIQALKYDIEQFT